MKRRTVCFPDELDGLLVAHAETNQENISDTIRLGVEKLVASRSVGGVSERLIQHLLVMQMGFIIKAFADTVDEHLVQDAISKANASAKALGISSTPERVDVLGGGK